MKKLLTILILCLVCVFCAVGFTACDSKNNGNNGANQEQGQTQPAKDDDKPAQDDGQGDGQGDDGQPAQNNDEEPETPVIKNLTKDEFFTELEKRESATAADGNRLFASADCKLVLNEGGNMDGTYTRTSIIKYEMEDEILVANAFVLLEDGETPNYSRPMVFGFSKTLKSLVETGVGDELIPEIKYQQIGDELVGSLDTEYQGVKEVFKYVFDANGYIKYMIESEEVIEGDAIESETGIYSIEFTVTAYNGTRALTANEFVKELREIEIFSYNDRSNRYATVTGTYKTHGGGQPDQTYSDTFALMYELDQDNYGHAYAYIELESNGSMGLDVLGGSKGIERTIGLAENGTFEVKQVGDKYDVTAEFEYQGLTMSAHYIYNFDGYVLYRLEKMGDAFSSEFIATVYTKGENADIEPDEPEPSEDEESDGLTGNRFVFESVDPESYASYLENSYIEFATDNRVTIQNYAGSNYTGTYVWMTEEIIHITAYSTNSGLFIDGFVDGDVLTIDAGHNQTIVYVK